MVTQGLCPDAAKTRAADQRGIVEATRGAFPERLLDDPVTTCRPGKPGAVRSTRCYALDSSVVRRENGFSLIMWPPQGVLREGAVLDRAVHGVLAPIPAPLGRKPSVKDSLRHLSGPPFWLRFAKHTLVLSHNDPPEPCPGQRRHHRGALRRDLGGPTAELPGRATVRAPGRLPVESLALDGESTFFPSGRTGHIVPSVTN